MHLFNQSLLFKNILSITWSTLPLFWQELVKVEFSVWKCFFFFAFRTGYDKNYCNIYVIVDNTIRFCFPDIKFAFTRRTLNILIIFSWCYCRIILKTSKKDIKRASLQFNFFCYFHAVSAPMVWWSMFL